MSTVAPHLVVRSHKSVDHLRNMSKKVESTSYTNPPEDSKKATRRSI